MARILLWHRFHRCRKWGKGGQGDQRLGGTHSESRGPRTTHPKFVIIREKAQSKNVYRGPRIPSNWVGHSCWLLGCCTMVFTVTYIRLKYTMQPLSRFVVRVCAESQSLSADLFNDYTECFVVYYDHRQ